MRGGAGVGVMGVLNTLCVDAVNRSECCGYARL